MRQNRGELRDKVTLETAGGPMQFAVGDRVQFTGNGRSKADKARGLINGRLGTLTAFHRQGDRWHATIDLGETPKGKRKTVGFDVGDGPGQFNAMGYGYASTIYRSQGRTIDQTYTRFAPHMGSASSYVALSRHRDRTRLYVAREHASNLTELAAKMSRSEEKRAAGSYLIDRIHLRQRAQAAAAEKTPDAERFSRDMSAGLEPGPER
jgi:ATP-dependent exoDNAse (exonuclease V) alpha subunit